MDVELSWRRPAPPQTMDGDGHQIAAAEEEERAPSGHVVGLTRRGGPLLRLLILSTAAVAIPAVKRLERQSDFGDDDDVRAI